MGIWHGVWPLLSSHHLFLSELGVLLLEGSAAPFPLQRRPLFRRIVCACCFAAPCARRAGGLPPAAGAVPVRLSRCLRRGWAEGPAARPAPSSLPLPLAVAAAHRTAGQDWSAQQARHRHADGGGVRPSLVDLECPVEIWPALCAVLPRHATAAATAWLA